MDKKFFDIADQLHDLQHLQKSLKLLHDAVSKLEYILDHYELDDETYNEFKTTSNNMHRELQAKQLLQKTYDHEKTQYKSKKREAPYKIASLTDSEQEVLSDRICAAVVDLIPEAMQTDYFCVIDLALHSIKDERFHNKIPETQHVRIIDKLALSIRQTMFVWPLEYRLDGMAVRELATRIFKLVLEHKHELEDRRK